MHPFEDDISYALIQLLKEHRKQADEELKQLGLYAAQEFVLFLKHELCHAETKCGTAHYLPLLHLPYHQRTNPLLEFIQKLFWLGKSCKMTRLFDQDKFLVCQRSRVALKTPTFRSSVLVERWDSLQFVRVSDHINLSDLSLKHIQCHYSRKHILAIMNHSRPLINES